MAILVPGGAGYIGSHNVKTLLENGREVVVIDNHCLTARPSPGRSREVPFTKGTISAIPADLGKIFANHRIDSVLHFAASSLVAESMVKPLDYFNNNVMSPGMQSLLAAMVRHEVDKNCLFIFRSRLWKNRKNAHEGGCAAFASKPTYGESKLMMEK